MTVAGFPVLAQFNNRKIPKWNWNKENFLIDLKGTESLSSEKEWQLNVKVTLLAVWALGKKKKRRMKNNPTRARQNFCQGERYQQSQME